MRVSFHTTEAALARMVIPRSRSRSLESIARSTTRWFSRYAPDCCSSRSTRVVLPWSTCAMMATLRRSIEGSRNQSAGPQGPATRTLLRRNIVTRGPDATADQAVRAGEVNPRKNATDRGAALLTKLRIECFRPKRPVIDILQRYRHLLTGAVDRDMPEELQALAGWQVLALLLAGRFYVNEFGAEGPVEGARAESTRVNWPAHEFPERLEILERGLVRIVVMRGGIVDISGEPNRISYA